MAGSRAGIVLTDRPSTSGQPCARLIGGMLGSANLNVEACALGPMPPLGRTRCCFSAAPHAGRRASGPVLADAAPRTFGTYGRRCCSFRPRLSTACGGLPPSSNIQIQGTDPRRARTSRTRPFRPTSMEAMAKDWVDSHDPAQLHRASAAPTTASIGRYRRTRSSARGLFGHVSNCPAKEPRHRVCQLRQPRPRTHIGIPRTIEAEWIIPLCPGPADPRHVQPPFCYYHHGRIMAVAANPTSWGRARSAGRPPQP